MNPADMEGMVPAAPTIPSILDRLKWTESARSTIIRPLYTGKAEMKASEPKSVRPSQRVSESLRSYLTVSHSTLFCTACQEQLISLKKDDVQCIYMTCFVKNNRDILKE